MDNQANFGIESDEQPVKRSKKKKKGRKTYIIESKYEFKTKTSLQELFGNSWEVWGRYHTRESRDEAFSALVKKSENVWAVQRFRKVDP